MRIRGIVRVATLQENPPASDQIEMLIKVQGVRPEQPRLLVVPYELLLGDETLEPEQVQGKGFDAEVIEDPAGRWVVREIAFATGRVLRAPEV
jgi:hypothetical protein